MKKIVLVLALTVMTFTSVFAKGAKDNTKDSKPKIGFLSPNLQTEFFITIDEGLRAECAKRGWNYLSVSFDNDSAKAVTSIENMVTSQCNIIIAMVSDTSCDDALREAQKSGVKIVECGVETDVHDLCTNLDQYKVGVSIGEMAAEWIKTNLNGKANIVIYTTYQNQDMQHRGEGIKDAIEKNSPDSKILEVVDIGKDVVGSGTTTTETMLQKYPDLNVIAAYGDAAATESNEAVKAAKKSWDDFGIFSCDGTTQALKAILNNDPQRGTIKFQDAAPFMAEYCEKLLAGENFPDVISFPCEKVTIANAADYMN